MELDDTPPDKRKSLLKGQRTKQGAHDIFRDLNRSARRSSDSWKIETRRRRRRVALLSLYRPTDQGRKKKKKKISGEKCVWLFSLLLFDWAWNSCRRGVISRERRHHPRSFMLWVLFFSFTSFRNFFFYYAFLYVYFSLMTGLRTVTLSLADSCTT